MRGCFGRENVLASGFFLIPAHAGVFPERTTGKAARRADPRASGGVSEIVQGTSKQLIFLDKYEGSSLILMELFPGNCLKSDLFKGSLDICNDYMYDIHGKCRKYCLDFREIFIH